MMKYYDRFKLFIFFILLNRKSVNAAEKIEKNISTEVGSLELNSASMPTALVKYLLTTNILDPINDRDIIESLSEYLLIAKDYNKSHLCMGTEVNEKAKEQITNILELV